MPSSEQPLEKKSLGFRQKGILLRPDETRVILRRLHLGAKQEYEDVIQRVLSLKEEDVQSILETVLTDFSSRHKNLTARLLKRFHEVALHNTQGGGISEAKKILIGSYFLFEYSAEAAALFNPSIVPHPDQSGLPQGALRFLVSLRSTGEGHISSVSFRSGVIDAGGGVRIDSPSRFLSEPDLIENPTYHKELFWKKLSDMGLVCDWSRSAMRNLGDFFTLEELRKQLHETLRLTAPGKRFDEDPTAGGMWYLAKCNYEISFPEDVELSERIIFPVIDAQSNGIEDVRLTTQSDDRGNPIYYGTYTAYDGRNVLPQLFMTDDFRHFKFVTLNGLAVRNKGIALFPRKVNGHFAMLSRQDGENIFLMYSDNVHFWNKAQILLRPAYPWEILKIGNCGSPIETDAGWLVLSHGVGPMRSYSLGAFLLDRDDPSKVIGRTRRPLMSPQGSEREGYVPNVLYTCGALLHNGRIILPYGISDRSIGFAIFPLDEILAAMK